MFAGPNGSGKTTLFRGLAREYSRLGVFNGEPFVNADDIDAELGASGALKLGRYGIHPTEEELHAWLRAFAWNDDTRRLVEHARMKDGGIAIDAKVPLSYAAAQIAGFIRSRLLAAGRCFSFETVMSHPGKIAVLRDARERGFRTYLYFVATDNVELNVRRVQVRMQVGGHAVPEEKIRERYRRSLKLLPQAVTETDRAFLIDNSTDQHVLPAEITGGKITAVHESDDRMPNWFLRFRDQFER
jgi:predicted ABC-type ATPase